MANVAIEISSADRACFFGRTGSGKTTLAKNLLRLVPSYAVLDAKHTYHEDGIKVTREFKNSLPRQIIRAPFADEEYHWQGIIEAVWRARNRVLYVDEGTLINVSRTALNPTLGKAIRTGRERNVGVWFGSQRPKDIPSAVFTEAEHFFVFQLQFDADRKKVASFTSSAMEHIIAELTGHQFVYYNVLRGTWQVYELRIRATHARQHASVR